MSAIRFGVRPKAGLEMANYLAWKHRSIAFEWMRRIGRNPLAFMAYDRAFRLWGHAVDRTKATSEVWCEAVND